MVSYLLLSLSHTVFVFSVDLLCVAARLNLLCVAARLNWPRTLSAQSLQSLCGTNWKSGNGQTFQKRSKGRDVFLLDHREKGYISLFRCSKLFWGGTKCISVGTIPNLKRLLVATRIENSENFQYPEFSSF